MEKVSTTVAAGAVASPWWLPTLADVSQTAALLAPILGVVWLLLQIISWLLKKGK